MSTVAGDLDSVTGIRATLAAVFLLVGHDAEAFRVCAFFDSGLLMVICPSFQNRIAGEGPKFGDLAVGSALR